MDTALTSAIVSLYNVRQALSTFGAGHSAIKCSRRWTNCGDMVNRIKEGNKQRRPIAIEDEGTKEINRPIGAKK